MKTLFNSYMKRLLLLAGVVCIFFACKKDFLEPKPLSIFTPESAFKDPRGIQGALAACDADIRNEMYGDAPPYLTEMMFSDLAAEGMNDNPGTNQNLNNMVTPTSNLDNGNGNRIGWFWNRHYLGIRYANVVIARIDDPVWPTEADRNATLGSAYFHRAMRYYRLVHQFGDVPFIGREIKSPKLDFFSTKREVILEKLKKDLEFAVQWVPDNVDRGKVTKGACGHLLTKVNLALGKFQDAIASASAVIDGGAYNLMRSGFGAIPKEDGDYLTKLGVVRDDVVARLHWPTNKAIAINKEVLFMTISREELVESRLDLRMMRQALPFWSKTAANQIYTPDGKTGTSDLAGREIKLVETFGRGIGRTPNTIYHAETIWDDPNDFRHKRYNWMNMTDLVYNHAALKGTSPYYGQPLQLRDANGKVLTLDTICNWYGWPHYKMYAPDPRRPQPQGGAFDWYIFRLAETYLLRAEAYVWNNQPEMAMADINQVRTRANCAPYTDVSKIDISTVLDERARELYWEEPRKTELDRVAFIYALTGRPYKGKTYKLDNFGSVNFYYDWIIEKNNFYRLGIVANNGQQYTISPYHVLFPVPQASISANTQGVINQNFGYDGYGRNVPPLTSIDPEDDN
ncbi:RagB/SusD family nutrient uptake outer membrane protein [Pollutibacter soli]|uniref:RagB/SusD family nutrient uptake outer membrane protein n=1 Tax=Pollutibacter soli TaxID=3034157 RepID=UPI0030134546